MAWSEGHFTFLDLIASVLSPVPVGVTLVNSGLDCSDIGAILVHTFDCDWIWVSDKLFCLGESYSSVWCNRVVPRPGIVLFASIFERLAQLFHRWNQWVATLEELEGHLFVEHPADLCWLRWVLVGLP